jgi:putative glutamine amidotransferase
VLEYDAMKKIPELPLIGMTCSPGLEIEGQPALGNTAAYAQAIEACGGVPVLLPPAASESVLLALYRVLDGVVLPGGPDVDPVFYEAAHHDELGPVYAELDRFEIALARLALADDKPLLAICRGQQVLNVALGGNLFQDLPSDHGKSLDHSLSLKIGWSRLAHSIEIERGTRLAQIIGKKSIRVNSLHHQAIKELGLGLMATASSKDGVIEAVEMPSKRFVIGMQCHPEELFKESPWAKQLFESFIQECQESRRGTEGG